MSLCVSMSVFIVLLVLLLHKVLTGLREQPLPATLQTKAITHVLSSPYQPLPLL